MRTIAKGRDFFYGTHKGYEIEIERIRPPVESFGGRHFYIRVFNDYGHAYDGYLDDQTVQAIRAMAWRLEGGALRAADGCSQDGTAERLSEPREHNQ